MSRGARERERERERASERTRIQWPSVLGAPGQRRRTSKYHLSESRRAFTCARAPDGAPLSLGRLGRIRSFGRIRVLPLYFLRARERAFLRSPQHGRCARRLALLLFRPAIVKYKRLVRSADSSPPPPLPAPLPLSSWFCPKRISRCLPLTAEIFVRTISRDACGRFLF